MGKPYVFPIITSEDPELAYRQYQNGLNYHNQKLKLLGKQIGEKLPLSSYLARHSWATAARNHNVPLRSSAQGWGTPLRGQPLSIWILWITR